MSQATRIAQIDTLSTEEQDVLMWIAESQAGSLEAERVTVADRPAFDWVSAVIDQLVRRGLLGRESIESATSSVSFSGLCTYLTSEGAQAVVELWRRRLGEVQDATVPPLH